MATALFLSDSRLVMLGVGHFGDHVVRLLAGDAAVELRAVTPVAAFDRAFADGAETAVLALWRPSPALCEEVDELAFRRGRAWLPVIMEHPNLLAGPLISPGSGPCFRCYQSRRAQHDTHHSIRTKLESAYDSDPGCGPAGYLPHHARTASGLVELALSGPVIGEVAQVNVLSGRTSSQRLIGVRGCVRCARNNPPGGNRALAALVSRGQVGGA